MVYDRGRRQQRRSKMHMARTVAGLEARAGGCTSGSSLITISGGAPWGRADGDGGDGMRKESDAVGNSLDVSVVIGSKT